MNYLIIVMFVYLLTILHRTAPFVSYWYKVHDCLAGNSKKWHEKYSWHHTEIFGYVACRTTSKVTGIGAAKHGWYDCKEIKSGKCSHIGSSNIMKQATLYTASSLRWAQIKQQQCEKLECDNKYARWEDEDKKFDLDLEKWSFNTDELKKPHAVPRRRFRCYIENWRDVKDKSTVMRK